MTKTLFRAVSMAALVAGAMTFGTAAFAGECPAAKIVADGKGQQDRKLAAKDVTDTVLAATDLAQEMVGLADHQFRLRRLEVQPGGIVPWHSHGDRPAMIYIVQGEITEFASTCAAPILHRAGDVAPERHMTSHWWQNTGTEKVVLISVDILHDQTDMNM
jgi:quercetin dioxygenase-like cupin family protein